MPNMWLSLHHLPHGAHRTLHKSSRPIEIPVRHAHECSTEAPAREAQTYELQYALSSNDKAHVIEVEKTLKGIRAQVISAELCECFADKDLVKNKVELRGKMTTIQGKLRKAEVQPSELPLPLVERYRSALKMK